MTPRMSQGCALVLLLAMAVATAAGMIAWGPIELQAGDHRFADERAWMNLPQALNVLACAPLVATGLWGMAAVSRSGWPVSLRTPLFAFFVLATLMSVVSAAYHMAPSDAGYVVTHLFAAGTMTMLALGFFAERVDPLFGSGPAVAAGCCAAGFAALWWFAGDLSSGHGDLRALFFLQGVPLLLIPAGALSLPGRFTAATDWLVMLSLYLLARSLGVVDAAVLASTGWISGHTLMHLLLAGVAGCLAYRVGVTPGCTQSLATLVESTQRSTSLNTSS